MQALMKMKQFARMLAIGVFLLAGTTTAYAAAALTAEASPPASPTLTVNEVWLTDDILHFAVTDKNTGESQMLELNLRSYANPDDEYVTVQATSKDGSISEVVQFVNPYYVPQTDGNAAGDTLTPEPEPVTSFFSHQIDSIGSVKNFYQHVGTMLSTSAEIHAGLKDAATYTGLDDTAVYAAQDSTPAYTALIAEAEKYLGYPYVWGGSSPSESFDCSGYVSWCINQSGIGSVGRQTAQGLYNRCTPVSPVSARSGDLIFFHSTYSAGTPVTHVGIYVGGGQMLHCGNPIQYTSIKTEYWQEHFYAFGRLSEN